MEYLDNEKSFSKISEEELTVSQRLSDVEHLIRFMFLIYQKMILDHQLVMVNKVHIPNVDSGSGELIKNYGR